MKQNVPSNSIDDGIRRFADMRKRRSRLSSSAPMPAHLEVV